MNRNNGSTMWIVKSAIVNPDCVIVAPSTKHMMYLRELYYETINLFEDFRGLYEANGNKEPLFVTTLNWKEKIVGRERQPIIFDNSCFI